nr:unnamed protein product [Spirometra erinaceieuropaei]
MIGGDDGETKFYEDLQAFLASEPKAEKLVALGDFNVRVETKYAAWIGVLSLDRIGSCNDSGLLLRTYAKYRLLWTSVFFSPVSAEEDEDTTMIAALEAAKIRSCPEVRSTGRAGDQGKLLGRWLDLPPLRHLQDEVPSEIFQQETGEEITK